MRMKNPFSDEPGDEEKGSGDAPAEEEQAHETRDSDGPDATGTGADDEQDAATEPEAGDEPRAEGESEGAESSGEAESGVGSSGEEGDRESSGDGGGGDESSSGGGGSSGGGSENIAAPSIGPDTVIERKPPEERLDFDKISDTDAVGKDKRREVVGGTYGPTRTRVLATFATFIVVVAALAVGFYFLAQELDQPPSENPDEAPWSLPEAPQQPPKPIQ